jgi:hypothetical protein
MLMSIRPTLNGAAPRADDGGSTGVGTPAAELSAETQIGSTL